MIALNWNKSALRSLIKGAHQRGFVGLAVDGVDVAAAIAGATDVGLLERAMDIAQLAGEPIWTERLARRACQIDATPRSRLRLATFLAMIGNRAQAEILLADIPADETDALYRALRGVLNATAGRPNEALEWFDAPEGRFDGHTPSRVALLTVQAMMEHYDIAHTIAFVLRLAERHPDHLAVRSSNLRCHLFAGDFERARQLSELSASEFERASRSNRRAFIEAVADSLEFFGWSSELFNFTREKIERDPMHWNLYGRAATAARMTSRDKEYTALIAAIPGHAREGAEALAVLCRWQVDENRLDEAAQTLEKMRPLSAGWFLDASLYLSLHTCDQKRLEEAFNTAVACGVSLLNPAIAYGIHTYYYNCTADRLRDCLAKLKPFDRSVPTNVYFWQIYLRCLVAVDDEQSAEDVYRTLAPGLQKSAALNPFAMFFDVARGRHDQARKGWSDYLRTTRHRSVNAPSSYPKTVRLRYSEKRGAVFLFATFYNGGDYIDWFLDHYRALGVDHFFITDNGSTDGSLERLCEEADVSVFSNPESFAMSAFGVLWVNHLMQRFAVDHWCFHVDVDEGFVFPDHDRGRTLRDLLSYCDANGFCAVPAIELDMYPERLDVAADVDPFAASCYFDTDYASVRSELPPYVMIQGGIRHRLTGVATLMQKTPLVRVAADMRYIECNHGTTHLPTADVSGALLHYKFVGDMKRRIEDAITRGEHFAGALFYRQLNTAVRSLGCEILLSQYSRRYAGPSGLADHGVIRGSPRWDAYATPPGKSTFSG